MSDIKPMKLRPELAYMASDSNDIDAIRAIRDQQAIDEANMVQALKDRSDPYADNDSYYPAMYNIMHRDDNKIKQLPSEPIPGTDLWYYLHDPHADDLNRNAEDELFDDEFDIRRID